MGGALADGLLAVVGMAASPQDYLHAPVLRLAHIRSGRHQQMRLAEAWIEIAFRGTPSFTNLAFLVH
jgi:hypothetical protein